MNHRDNSEIFAFPDPDTCTSDGLIALGGDLKPERLILAYQSGIFPWYTEEPIKWYSPDPRMVLFPGELHIPKSLAKVIKQDKFEIKVDSDFRSVIKNCALRRQGETWITEAMIESFIQLHEIGMAHSIEAYSNGKLAGGIYGMEAGDIFSGESMFFHQPNASKAALIYLIHKLQVDGFILLDCQVYTDNLARFGARQIRRNKFLEILRKSI